MSAPLKVLSVFGTRPEAVKMAPVIQALEACDEIDSRVVVTAQHRQMLDQVLSLFEIRPDIDLDLMRPNQSLHRLTADILIELDPVLERLQPDWLLVQGDTTTVMAGALLGHYRRIRIGHVEAGLRTGDKWQPFPEETNRRIAGVLSDLHFAPTEHSRQNLLQEGVPDEAIRVTGNPAIDALLQAAARPIPAETSDLLDHLGIGEGRGRRRLVLVTAHRRENFGRPLEDICAALRELAESDPGLALVYPVHLNPNVVDTVYPRLDGVENITLLPPLDYLPMVHLMKASSLVLTDSGGLQEEATGLRKPALVMRNRTERPEGVEAGVLKLVGTDPDAILAEARRLLYDPQAYQAMADAPNPFGDGRAAGRIVQSLLESSNRR